MNLSILATFLVIAAATALPVVEDKADPLAIETPEDPGDRQLLDPESGNLVPEGPEPGNPLPEDRQPGDLQTPGEDLQTDATIWGLGWGRRRRYYGYGRSYPSWYGGWGGYP